MAERFIIELEPGVYLASKDERTSDINQARIFANEARAYDFVLISDLSSDSVRIQQVYTIIKKVGLPKQMAEINSNILKEMWSDEGSKPSTGISKAK